MRDALLSAFGLCLFSFSPAHAYLDAGTGSILLQVIIGAVAAGLAVLAGLRGRIRAVWFRRKRADPGGPSTPSGHGER